MDKSYNHGKHKHFVYNLDNTNLKINIFLMKKITKYIRNLYFWWFLLKKIVNLMKLEDI